MNGCGIGSCCDHVPCKPERVATTLMQACLSALLSPYSNVDAQLNSLRALEVEIAGFADDSERLSLHLSQQASFATNGELTSLAVRSTLLMAKAVRCSWRAGIHRGPSAQQ